LIHVYGTSHVSGDSMEVINEKLEEHDPDIVALELDLGRLNALLNGKTSAQGGPVFLKLVKKFQDFIGSRTGVMPGEEMLYAYRKSIAENREVALIDQDIRATINRLETVSKKEKIRAMAEAGAAFLLPGKFDASEIPEEEMIQKLLDEMEKRYPGLYRVFLEERNQVMADYLRNLQKEEPDAEIVAFVGAAHRKDLEDRLKVEK
jgi:pheromone shutdown protein TraB